MPLVGTLFTMPLPDLLQWLGAANKTGTLQIERNRAVKTLRFRQGRVVGCSSDEPAQRLGQFLISRKRITEDQLRQALLIMEETSQFLGQTLVELGALSQEDLVVDLKDQAEEIIYSLFDWSDGVFRFEETVDPRIDVFPLDLRIDDVLLRGLQRVDEMNRVRTVLHDPNLVLRYTAKPPGPEIFGDETSRSMYSAIDGERTLADILLHLHATEYQVKRFFYELHENGYVEIARVKPVEPAETPASAPAAPKTPVASADEPDFAEFDLELDTDLLGAPSASATPAGETTVATSVVTSSAHGRELTRARELMAEGRLEEALEVPDLLYRENPADDALRRLTAEAEAAFVEACYRTDLPAEMIPVLTCAMESLASQSLTPEEFFLLSRIDGSWDVKSIIQVAPFREVDALRTLKRMCLNGTIELHQPA